MKRTTLLVLLVTTLGLTNHLFAQNAKQSADEEKERQELRRKFSQGMQARKLEQARLRDKSVAVQSKYNNRESEIIAKLNTEGIPADFPVYKPEYTNEQYTIVMNKWYAANPTLLKKETTTNEQK